MKVENTVKKPYGICPASMTIWNVDQTYSKKDTEKYLIWLLDNNAQFISTCENTDENIAMNVEEQRGIVEHVSGSLGGQILLACGTGRYDTLNVVKISKFAQGHGADCVMVILPFYLSPRKKVAMQHFRGLEEVLDIEIMVYNNLWFAGYEPSVQEVKESVGGGTIQYIKTAHGDPDRVHELKHHCKDDLTVFYGYDYAAMEGLLIGADGWLSGFPAIFPKQCRRLRDACLAKDVDVTTAAQNNIQPCIDYFLYNKVSKVPHQQEVCRYTLQAQGLDVGLPHKSLGELDDADKEKIEKLLADME